MRSILGTTTADAAGWIAGGLRSGFSCVVSISRNSAHGYINRRHLLV